MIRGWCPTVHAPMPSGDGLLVRVKPFGGQVSADQVQALAAAVAECGNGVVELTGRGNLQLRGVRDVAGFARAVVAAGLADADPDREARRNVVTVPPCDAALVAEMEELLASTPGLAPKFCVVVAGDQVFLDGKVTTPRTLTHPSPKGRGRFVLPPNRLLPLPLGEGRGEGAGHLLYPPFGETDAAGLARFTAGFRTTPWRALLSRVPVPGFPTAPGTIAACPGAPACAGGSVPARADAARLAAAGFGHLHVSGCAKGCAHGGATTTLVGRDGCYDLVRHGRASDPSDLRGLTLQQAMATL